MRRATHFEHATDRGNMSKPVKPRRAGRPPVADAARSAPVQVRLSPAERATLRARCDARGVTVSDALRDLARGAGLLD